jgi:hypothetical protein
MKLDQTKGQKFLDSNTKFEQQLDWNRLVELDKNNEIENNFLTSIELKKLNSAKSPIQSSRLFSESFVSSGGDSGINFRNHSSLYDHSFKLVDDKYSSSNSDELPNSSSSSASSTTTETSDDLKNHNGNSTSTENEEENATTTSAESMCLLNTNNGRSGFIEQNEDLNQQKAGLYFKTERSIQLSVNKTSTNAESNEDSVKPQHERDDFDDLVDLSHRPEKIEFKKESSLEKKRQKEEEEKKIYNALCSSSLPPLPPLPYSFVKLEHKAKLTPKSSSFLSLSTTNRVKPPSAFRNESQSTRGLDKSEDETTKKVVQAATTRLIIPINTDKKNKSSSPFCITTTSSIVNDSKAKSPKRSNSLPRNGLTAGSDEINVQIYDFKTNTNIHTNNTNVMNSEKTDNTSEKVVNGQKEAVNETQCSKQKDVGREWEQISKIFASLELLLNEVVEDTSNNLKSSRGMPHVSPPKVDVSEANPLADKIFQELSTTTTTASSDDLDAEYVTDSSDSNNDNPSGGNCLNVSTKNCRRMNRSSEHMDHLLNKKKLKYIEISEFLKRINMSKYEKTFLLNGYDDLNFIVICVLY